MCDLEGIYLQDAISEALEVWMAVKTGRLDVQKWTSRRPVFGGTQVEIKEGARARHDLTTKTDDDVGVLTSSSHQGGVGESEGERGSLFGRPDGQSREEALLAFYCEHTGNRPTVRDQQVLATLADYPDLAIKAGIVRSILLCTTRVNSLSYCVGAITEFAESGSGPDYLQYALSKLAKKQPRPVQPNLPGVGAEVIDLKGRNEGGGSA